MSLNELDKLIPQYAQNKNELDSYKKICERENNKIKSIMKDFVVTHYEAGGYRANYSVSQRETLNEELLLSLFSSPSFAEIVELYSIIKTKPYVDFDALEKAIYDNKLTEAQLLEINKARETKDVVTLRVSKIKETEEEN